MKTLVIGGSGFIGSHVCDKLSEVGHQVRIFDRVPSPWLRTEQKMIIGDLLDDDKLAEAVNGCNVVYNFASLCDLEEAQHQPLETARINVLGNVLVMEACRQANVQRYIYASTLYVYSREGGFYRCSKQSAEHYVEQYQLSYGLDYTIMRYGSLYGPRSDHRNGLWRIVKHALETESVYYEGSPETMREYIHVEDAARASVDVIGEEFRNQHIILTGVEKMRVYDLLKMLAEIMDLPDSVEFGKSDLAGHYVRTPYAYQPKMGRKFIPNMHVDLGQGLLELIEEVRNS